MLFNVYKMLFSILVSSLLVIFVYLIIKLEQKRRLIERDFGHIRSPKELVGIGNLLAMSRNSISNFEGLIEKVCTEPVNKLTFAGYLAFSTYDPVIVKQLLLLPGVLEKPYFFEFFELDHGLFSAYCKFFFEKIKVIILQFLDKMYR